MGGYVGAPATRFQHLSGRCRQRAAAHPPLRSGVARLRARGVARRPGSLAPRFRAPAAGLQYRRPDRPPQRLRRGGVAHHQPAAEPDRSGRRRRPNDVHHPGVRLHDHPDRRALPAGADPAGARAALLHPPGRRQLPRGGGVGERAVAGALQVRSERTRRSGAGRRDRGLLRPARRRRSAILSRARRCGGPAPRDDAGLQRRAAPAAGRAAAAS